MSQSTTPAFTPTARQRDSLDRNLTALEHRQPDVAMRLRAIEIPDNVIAATGRDGTSTVQILDTNGVPSWFGQSSMPSISAPAFFADARYRGGNAALPGVFTGYEPLALLNRLPRFVAVFVLEDDPLNVAIACHLYNYANEITAGRLVFVLADELDANLAAYIRRYPGYDMPSHMHHVPQRSSAALTNFQRRLEQAGQTAVDIQTKLMNDSVAAIAARPRALLPESPCVALLTTDARPETGESIDRIARALDGLGWTHSRCLPETPEQCHAVARLQTIERCSADLVLFVNHGANGLRGALPSELPVVSWWFDSVPASELALDTRRSFDLDVVTSPADAPETSVSAGQPDHVLRCDPAVDDKAFCVRPSDGGRTAATEADVLVPVDLPDDRATACGVSLATHVTLWNSVLRIVSERIDRPVSPDADSILADAAAASSVPLGDAGVRARFVELIQTCAIPAARARSLVTACRHAGLRVSLLGSNWFDTRDDAVRWGGAIPPATDLCQRFHSTGIVALPSADLASVQHALDALSSGASVCMRADRPDFERRFPGLKQLADHIVFAPTSRSLATHVKRVLAGERWQPEGLSEESLSNALAEHTVARRLQWIVNQVRVRQTAATTASPRTA